MSNTGGRPESLLATIREFAVARCDPTDAAHDELHLCRVVANAKMLMAAEPRTSASIDAFVVLAACWLHDNVLLPKGTGYPGEAAARSATVARRLLVDLGVDAATAEAVAASIETHSFSASKSPTSIEGCIVQDADRLDALGAVGIARFWTTMQRVGGRMYNANEPLPVERELDDRRWALDHIERKLLRLSSSMHTATGRAEAERRTAFLLCYRDEFLREIATRDAPE